MGLFGKSNWQHNQKYSKLKQQCIKRGEKFSDPRFPPHDSSLYYSKQPPGVILWKRPHELLDGPRLFIEGVSSSDVTQGQLGNCWFVAACATLAGVKDLWTKVIPGYKDQEYHHTDFHAGIFHFRFWRFGSWVDVVVDDLLPTIGGQLIFVHSKQRGEFWCALLEKAYAKLHGSYEALEGGNLSDALVDLTGGVSAHLDLTIGGYGEDFEKRKQLFKMMRKEMDEHALMCCAIAPHNHEEPEMRTSVGLVKGHAYGITDLRKVNIGETNLFTIFNHIPLSTDQFYSPEGWPYTKRGRQKLRMVRLKNPWGEKEWSGAFSDGGRSKQGYAYSPSHLTRLCSRSPEWAKVSSTEREHLGLVFEDDGEFWMTFEDFLEHFTDLSICFLINTSLLSRGKTWHEAVFHDAWTIGVKGHQTDRAGGCLNHKESFLRNPQYRFDVKDEKDDVIIQLMQKDAREHKKDGIQHLVLGFHIMKVEVNREYRVHRIHEAVATSDYIKTRSIFLREQLQKGRYVVLPTTFKPGETGEFILRIFTNRDYGAVELTQEAPSIPWYSCVKRPVIVTAVTVKAAQQLQTQSAFGEMKNQVHLVKQGKIFRRQVKGFKVQVEDVEAIPRVKQAGEPDAYCIIKCEGETVRTSVDKGTSAPKWDTTAIFYRSRPEKPIIIEVWSKSLLIDGFLGRAQVLAPINTNTVQVELPLYGRSKEKDVLKEGVVVVQVYSDDDLTSI